MCLPEIPTTVTNTIHQQANMAPFISNSMFLLYPYFRFHDYKSYMYSEFLKYHKVQRCTIWILTPWLSASFDTSKIIAIASSAKLPTHGWQCKRTITSQLILQSTSVHCFTWNNLINALLINPRKNHLYAKMRTWSEQYCLPSTTFMD